MSPIDCPHAASCAGCTALDVPYEAQLARKREVVAAAFARHAELASVRLEATHGASATTRYRTRAKLVVGPRGAIGLYGRNGDHVVVDVPGCVVVAEAIARALDGLRGLLREPPAAAGAALVPSADGGALDAVDLREALEGARAAVLVTLVLREGRVPSRDALAAAGDAILSRCEGVRGVATSLRAARSAQVLGEAPRPLAGESRLVDTTGGVKHLATFGSFVQASREQAAYVHASTIDAIAAAFGRSGLRAVERLEGLSALDLYGGSGAIALALASAGARVRLAESFAPAADEAREAARLARLDGVTTEAGDAGEVARAVAARGERVDAVVVNPPRRGVAPATRAAIAALSPRVCVYVSCDPSTLARDAAHLARLGLGMVRATPIDMIPLTDEVETVAVLRACPIPAPRVIYEDDEVVVVEKPGHEPTIPHPEHARSLLDRTRALASARDAVPVHRLDAGTSGLVIFAKQRRFVAGWARALAAGAKTYVALARGLGKAKGAIAAPLFEKGALVPARTRFRRVAIVAGQSLVAVSPEQGRTHQIRKHLAATGHPIVGDVRYGHAPTNRHFEQKCALDRTFLHCARIQIVHPSTTAALVLEAPLAGDLTAVLARAGADPAVAAAWSRGAAGSAKS